MSRQCSCSGSSGTPGNSPAVSTNSHIRRLLQWAAFAAVCDMAMDSDSMSVQVRQHADEAHLGREASTRLAAAERRAAELKAEAQR